MCPIFSNLRPLRGPSSFLPMRIVIIFITTGLISFSPIARAQQLIADFCFCDPDNITENTAGEDGLIPVDEEGNPIGGTVSDGEGIYNNTGESTSIDIPASIFNGIESVTLEFDVFNQKNISLLITAGNAVNAENNVENGMPFRIGNKSLDNGNNGNVGLQVDYYTTADPDNSIKSGFIPGSQIDLNERATIVFIYDHETGIAELFKNSELVWETPPEQRTPGETFYLETKTTDEGMPILTLGQNMNADAPQTPSYYSFRATDAACPIVAAPTVNEVAPLCGAGDVTLTAVADKEDGDYRWYGPDGTLIAGESNRTYTTTLTETSTFSVSVLEGPCESKRTSVTARVIPIPEAPIVSDPFLCSIGEFVLEASSDEGDSYHWYDAEGTLLAVRAKDGANNVLGEESPGSFMTQSLTTTTDFYVAVVSEGCEGERAKITARVETPPTPPSVTEQVLCEPDSTTLVINDPEAGMVYRWYDRAADGDLLAEGTDSQWRAQIKGDTSFYVSAWNGECESNRVIALAKIYQAGSLDVGPDEQMIPDGSVALQATEGYVSYDWYPTQGLDDPASANPTASPAQTTTYWVTATTVSGCEETDQVTVEVVDYPIPTAFTPNGDGLNDQWDLAFLERYPNCEVWVYNRWGESVFQSQGYATPWDGRYAGHPPTLGTYTYRIDLKNGASLIQGSVLLLK